MNVILTFVEIQQPVVNYWQKIKEEIIIFFSTLGDYLFLFLTVWEFVLCLKNKFKAYFLFCTIIHV